ncbi:MAG: hypothetical protein OXH75_27760 [Acidobacteria bacterium]|nr:hypothetical protein [Acidobacteriota bacterium]
METLTQWLTPALLIALFTWLRRDITQLHNRIDAQGKEQRADNAQLRDQIGQLRERMAHLEGLLEGLREAITGKRVA